MTESPLPKFDHPPVREVLCCVYFKELLNLHGPHLGAFWTAIQDGFPRTETAVQLPPLNFPLESIGRMLSNLQINRFMLPRTIFVNKDSTSLIQVQRDRFVFNWRQEGNEVSYPGYDVIIKDFYKYLDIFTGSLRKSEIENISINGLELGYVNQLHFGKELGSLVSIDEVIPFFRYIKGADKKFSVLSAVNSTFEFTVDDENSKLLLSIQSSQVRQDGTPVVRMDLVARRSGIEIAPESIGKWFDSAHKWIVTGFCDITDKDKQYKVWGRK